MSWEKRDLPARALPNVPAVYAVFIDGSLVYVGQTVDLRNRFSEHNIRYGYARILITPWCDVPETAVLSLRFSRSRKYGDWAMRELRLIRRLKPRFNQRGRGRKPMVRVVA